jgi:hypothetical protein
MVRHEGRHAFPAVYSPVKRVGGDFFSRGFDHVISGTTGWAEYQTPFFLKAGEKPDLIRLNLVTEGPGKIDVKDVELLKAPPR